MSACGSDQKQVEDPYLPPTERKTEPVVGPAPECVDEHDEPVRCEEDSECCEGFVCGIDPELSARIKHCIYAGN
jgi:hypothetical protein